MKGRHPACRLAWAATLLWTGVVAGSLWWNARNAEEQGMEMAYAEARATLNKDYTFRRWGNMHGGVYVPVTATQKSVPWLKHIPGRDVVTTDGRRLTLLNPASMLRQMMDFYTRDFGVQGRIVGLKQLNPDNAPDDWERKQLEAFVRGEKKEVWEVASIGGKPQLRYLRAMLMEPGCDKCHAVLGYKTGDMRGAIGLNLPLAPYLERIALTRKNLAATHLLIWLVGLAGILWGGHLTRQWLNERERSRAELLRHRDNLEKEVEIRTRDLAVAKEAADMASRAKSDFLANMSHEIRTPLNAITGLAHLIRKSGVSSQQAARLDKIDAAGRHLLEIIGAILDLSKIEAGKFQLDEREFNVGTLVGNVISILHERCQAKRLEMRAAIGPSVPACLIGDPTRLQQALLNYAGNAVKFTESGRITIRVRIEEEEDAEARPLMRFEVEDSGVGIPPAVLARLFLPFEQADNSTTREHGGTGLGLVITRRMAELMGGGAGAESVPGQGSTFWFTARLGKCRLASGASPVARVATPEDSLRAGHAGKRVLLAEDEPINREIALELLQDAGLAVDVAVDGMEAVEKVQRNRYALILMDMQMPRLDGLAATGRIRELPNGADVPIVAMTANAFSDDKARCLAAGMDEFIAKPVDPDKLFLTLLVMLETAPGAVRR